jgi:hypothetical protein
VIAATPVVTITELFSVPEIIIMTMLLLLMTMMISSSFIKLRNYNIQTISK